MDPAKQSVIMALRNVIDPEVGLNVVEMGLVYGLSLSPSSIDVALSLTSPGCPLGDSIVAMAREALGGVAGEREIRLSLVWDPPWNPEMISALGRRALGMPAEGGEEEKS